MKPLVFIFFVLFALPAQAAIEAYDFADAQQEADFNRLVKELRCLVCQNQNLADSDADLARDLRRETYEMLRAGNSPEQVLEFMVARYGDFVLYRPQFKASTWLLWLGPFALLLVVLVVVVRRLRASAGPDEVDSARLDEARRLLDDEERAS